MSESSKFCSKTSVRGKAWRPVEVPHVPAVPGHDPALAKVMAGRGIVDTAAHLRPNFKAYMPDPGRLIGMDAAAARVRQAVEDGEIVGVIGDYDVDGATSTSIVVRFLASLGHRAVDWRIPHRIADGYGPNPTIVQDIRHDSGATLLLILDSGTTSFEAVDHARALGMDVVIVDHHEPSPNGLPDAILVNPKQPGEDRELAYLCTAGLAFLFVVAIMRDLRASDFFARRGLAEPDVKALLGLVALGTVADVVPLVGLNRAYVSLGMARMGDNVGLRALAEVTQKGTFDAHACGFVFGPCLNAAGRIEDMRLSVELLLTEDPTEAAALADRLFELNKERQKLTFKAIEEAKDAIAATGQGREGVIVVHDEAWHPGIVGIVAGRIRETYDLPSVVIGSSGKGSCRSVDGFSIGNCIIEAYGKGILVKGGGHDMAAGLTIAPERVVDLKRFADGLLEGFVAPPVKVDLVIDCGTARVAMVEDFERLAPFGMGNTRPRVVVVGGMGRKTFRPKNIHVKLVLSGPYGEMDVMAWNAVGTPLGDALEASVGRRIDVLGTLVVESYAGTTKVGIKPEDVMLGVDSASVAA